MSRCAAGDVEISAGERARNDIGSGFDAIRNDAVLGAVKFGNALDTDGRSSTAFDVRAHFVEQVGEVGDFGLTGAILHDGFTVGEGGSHQQIFGAGDRDLVENNLRAFKPLGTGFDIAMVLANGCAETLQPFDVQIDGTSA